MIGNYFFLNSSSFGNETPLTGIILDSELITQNKFKYQNIIIGNINFVSYYY